MGRRDYERIFSQLNASLYGACAHHIEYRYTSSNSCFPLVDDPELWGYSHVQDDNGGNVRFIPSFDSHTALNPSLPFKLHLVGHGAMAIPPGLENIVILHYNLDYTDFYTLMSGMDLCIPAFPKDSDTNYVDQASSTVAMCMENNVRALVGLISFAFPPHFLAMARVCI